jgi:hypothetical protein
VPALHDIGQNADSPRSAERSGMRLIQRPFGIASVRFLCATGSLRAESSSHRLRASAPRVSAQRRHQHCRLVSGAANAENDFESEQALRMTLLEVFYTRRRLDPRAPNLFPSDLEGLTGTPREHLEFTTWFLVQKSLLIRTDNSSLSITAAGVEYLEQHYLENSRRRRRLRESAGPDGSQAVA